MSYVPAVWLVIFLVRMIFRAANSKGGGAGTSGGGFLGSSSAGGVDLGAANIVLFALTFFVAAPVAMVLAMLVGELPLPFPAIFLLGTVAVAAGFYITFSLPHWLAWRLLGPWGWGSAGRWMLRLGVFRSAAAREGAQELYRARFEGDWDARGQPVSLWTIAAVAIHAERLGEPQRADALLKVLGAQPCRIRSWRRPAAVAGEALAWSALRAGDGARAARCAAIGWGRDLWLPRLLAAVALGEPVPAFRLVSAWLGGPQRRASLPALRRALRDTQGVGTERSARRLESSLPRERPLLLNPEVVGPMRAHLAFLAHAAAGGTLRASELEGLAASWSSRLALEWVRTGLLRRALELGAQGVPALQGELRSALVAELELLAEQAEGEWTAPGGTLAATLRQKALGQACEAVEREVRDFETAENDKAESRAMAGGLEELERWLAFGRAVATVQRRGGNAALHTLWYGGLRYTACNWGVFLVRQRGEEVSWAAFLMHSWSADLAARVGDEEIRKLSQGNVKLTRAGLG